MESHRSKQLKTLSPGICIYAGSLRNALELENYHYGPNDLFLSR